MFAISDQEKIIHLIGLGGIGMSGLAEILSSLGYKIQGSDQKKSSNIDRLEKLGIQAFIGHDPKNIENADVVVYSSAINQNNSELLKAKELGIVCLSRADMLSQIIRFKKSVVVSGSHGKTTVTSICASILEMAGFDPTIVNGGVINSYKTNAKLGSGDWTVVESDESDGSFVKFFPTLGIVTNIDHEHTNHYGSFENLTLSFKTFLENIPFYGAGIVCIDDKNVKDILKTVKDRRMITYSINDKNADFFAFNIDKTDKGSKFDIKIFNDTIVENFQIPLLGDHNIKNSLSAIAMAWELKIDITIVKSALLGFGGVNRRFTNLGYINDILFVDDYAHHPTEIRALLESAKQKTKGKITIICQPHRFTRLKNLFNEFCECFSQADRVIILPVYKADDNEDSPIKSQNLFEKLQLTNIESKYANDSVELKNMILELIKNKKLNTGDIVLFAGAGNISKWAHEIYEELKNRL